MPTNFRVCVLGEGGVGKSALTVQFVNYKFVATYDPTIEDAYTKQFKVDDEVVLLDILDTAGQEELSAMREQYMRSAEGFLFLYSITSRSTFEALELLKTQLARVKDTTTTPIVLVGCKSDLAAERQVSVEEGQKLAKLWSCPFIETSAAQRVNVDQAFEALVRHIRIVQKSNLYSKANGRKRTGRSKQKQQQQQKQKPKQQQQQQQQQQRSRSFFAPLFACFKSDASSA